MTKKETKRETFLRLAEKRTNTVIERIRILSNCANPYVYEYTEQDVRKIFGAIDDDEKGTPLPNNTRCRRCGTCMGACPERIIGFKDYNVDMIGSMVKSIEVPDDDEDKLRIDIRYKKG